MYKKNLEVQHSVMPVSQFEHMVKTAVLHGAPFSEQLFLDANWQLEVYVGVAPLKLRFKCYTTSNKVINKNSGMTSASCEFDMTLNTSGQFENQYTPVMNEVLNSYGVSLIPYTQMIPIKKEVMERAAHITQTVFKSGEVSTAEHAARNGNVMDAIHAKAMGNQANTDSMTASQKVVHQNSTKAVLKDKTPVKQKPLKQKGFLNMFKRK